MSQHTTQTQDDAKNAPPTVNAASEAGDAGESPPTSPAVSSKKRAKWPWIVAGAGSLMAAFTGAYFYLVGTPYYTLFRIVTAIEEKNETSFYAFVDLDAVVIDALDKLMSDELLESLAEANGIEGPSLAQSVHQILKTQVVAEARGALQRFITTGKLSSDGDSEVAQMLGPFAGALATQVHMADMLRSIEEVQIRGDEATVEIELKWQDSPVLKPIVAMRKEQGLWRVKAIANIVDIADELAAFLGDDGDSDDFSMDGWSDDEDSQRDSTIFGHGMNSVGAAPPPASHP